MSRTTTTEWTCDRCGAKTALQPNEQPFGWATIYYVRPPLADPRESDPPGDQVCADCLDAYFEWYRAGFPAVTA